MRKPTYHFATVVVASSAAAFIAGAAMGPASSAPTAPEQSSNVRVMQRDDPQQSKLRSLQRELVETLRTVRTMLEKGRASGMAMSSDVIKENIELLTAELDMCDTDSQRLVVLERIADQYKALEQAPAEVVQRTGTNPTVYLNSKAAWLKAEIAVEHCRLHQTPATKL